VLEPSFFAGRPTRAIGVCVTRQLVQEAYELRSFICAESRSIAKWLEHFASGLVFFQSFYFFFLLALVTKFFG